MPKPYTIALYATNTYHAADADGVVPVGTPAPPTTLPAVTAPNGWVFVDGLYLDPGFTVEESSFTTPNLSKYQDNVVRRSFKFETFRFAFPGDWADYDAVERAVSGVKRYLFLHIVQYDLAAGTFHGAAEALAVTCKHTPTHDHTNGQKYLTLEFDVRTPED